jgi:hypothetical protein
MSADTVHALSVLEERVVRQERGLAALESVFLRFCSQMETELSALRGWSEAGRAEAHCVAATFSNLRSDLSVVQAAATEVRNELARMDGDIEGLKADVRSVSAVANSSQAGLAEVRLTVRNLPIRRLETDISRLSAEVRSVRAVADSSQTRLDTLEAVVQNLPIRHFERDISSLRAEVLSGRPLASASAEPLSPPASDPPRVVSTIQLFVELPSGKHRVLAAPPTETIESIKAEIAALEGIPVACQWLSFYGHRLNDARSLASYSISGNSVITVHIRAIPKRIKDEDDEEEDLATSPPTSRLEFNSSRGLD